MVKLVNQLGPEDPEITEEKCGKLLFNSLSSEIQFCPSQGVLDETISPDKLGMISSDELRFSRSSWSERLHTVRQVGALFCH